MRQKLRSGLISAVVCVVSLFAAAEFFSALYLRYVVHVNWAPAYLGGFGGNRHTSPWLTETAPWGAWHVFNALSRHESQCYAVALRSNSYGARDRERAREGAGPGRVVVLGDSFTEGFGVAEDERLTNVMERRLGQEFLNFGASYDLGPLQYQILYAELASGFTHDRVLVMFLPDNDFTDNDADYWRTRRAEEFLRRHRPYYQKIAPGEYRPFYPTAEQAAPGQSLDAASRPLALAWRDVERWIRQNLWTYKAADYAIAMLGSDFVHSGYYDFRPEQLDAVLWSFGQIKARAGAREVTILVIPRLVDFLRRAGHDESPLLPALRRFGAENDVHIVDLLEPMRRLGGDPARFFLPCDGHWNAAGNAAAAEALIASGRFGPVPPR